MSELFTPLQPIVLPNLPSLGNWQRLRQLPPPRFGYINSGLESVLRVESFDSEMADSVP